MSTMILSVALVLAIFFAIRGDYRGARWQHYLGKPLATLLIIGIALVRTPDAPRGYALAIVVGLGCSLAGDIFLMLPGDRFIAGLVSFLIAHLAYIVAFVVAFISAPGAAFAPASALTLLPLLLYGALFFRRLRPHFGDLRAPVLVYLLVIVAMGWCALDRWRATGTASATLAALGALLFITSDSVLAHNRFIGRFAAAQAIVLGTYFAAQWLIAFSL